MQRSKMAREADVAQGDGAHPPAFGSADTWYHALYEDTMCLVAVIDRDGKLLDLNLKAKEALDLGDDIEAYTLFDLMPEPVARERLQLIGRALDERRAVTVEGMVAGAMRRCTYRPLENADAVLVVSHPSVFDAEFDGEDLDHECIRARHDDLGKLASLTDRELEVMALIGEGLPTSEIARRLHRSEKTVEWHRASLGHKLGVTNRVELARLALQSGICRLPRLAPEFTPIDEAEPIK